MAAPYKTSNTDFMIVMVVIAVVVIATGAGIINIFTGKQQGAGPQPTSA